MTLNRPLVVCELIPDLQTDLAGLQSILRQLQERDTLATVSEESGRILLGGQSETHLENIIENIINAGINLKVGPPQISYLESITRKAEADYTHKRVTGGTGEFAQRIIGRASRKVSVQYLLQEPSADSHSLT